MDMNRLRFGRETHCTRHRESTWSLGGAASTNVTVCISGIFVLPSSRQGATGRRLLSEGAEGGVVTLEIPSTSSTPKNTPKNMMQLNQTHWIHMCFCAPNRRRMSTDTAPSYTRKCAGCEGTIKSNWTTYHALDHWYCSKTCRELLLQSNVEQVPDVWWAQLDEHCKKEGPQYRVARIEGADQ